MSEPTPSRPLLEAVLDTIPKLAAKSRVAIREAFEEELRAATSGTAGDARASLAQVFDSIPDLDAKWRKLIEEAFAAETVREVSVAVTCKVCDETRKYMILVNLPNWAARTKALDLLLTQAKGKPAETKTVDLNVFAAQTREELEGMSDEQLALVAAGAAEEVSDGK